MNSICHITKFKGLKYINPCNEKLTSHIYRDEQKIDINVKSISSNNSVINDKLFSRHYVVKDKSMSRYTAWGDKIFPISQEHFQKINISCLSFMTNRTVYIQEGYASADKKYKVEFRLYTQNAQSCLYFKNLYSTTEYSSTNRSDNSWSIFYAPDFRVNFSKQELNHSCINTINFATKEIIIGGYSDPEEIKKAINIVMQYLLPIRYSDSLTLSCCANIGVKGDTSLFFGLDESANTLFRMFTNRRVIGEDLHGWGNYGIFNIKSNIEPVIPKSLDKFKQDSLSRGDYVIKKKHDLRGGVPSNIFLFTRDNLGVLPLVSKLSLNQVLYHFLSGYTMNDHCEENSTNSNVVKFSPCYTKKSLPLIPPLYTKIFEEKLLKHNVTVWLLNIGSYGGPLNTGNRIPIEYTSRIVSCIQENTINSTRFERFGAFNLQIPKFIEGLPSSILNPIENWGDHTQYIEQESMLVKLFNHNFRRYRGDVPHYIHLGGPAPAKLFKKAV